MLLLLTAAAWFLVVSRVAGMVSMTSRLTPALAAMFLGIWVLMMAAMMFPGALPMILLFSKIQAGRRGRGVAAVPTWLFIGSYLAVWTAAGLIAFVAAAAIQDAASHSSDIMRYGPRLSGLLFLAAGAYQLSPWKRACLSKCRSPLTFIMESWRDGYRGAVRMGTLHGLYCLGCCWLLLVILFPLGIMNVAAMAAVSVVILAEKCIPGAARARPILGAVLGAYGFLVLILPRSLPAL